MVSLGVGKGEGEEGKGGIDRWVGQRRTSLLCTKYPP